MPKRYYNIYIYIVAVGILPSNTEHRGEDLDLQTNQPGTSTRVFAFLMICARTPASKLLQANSAWCARHP